MAKEKIIPSYDLYKTLGTPMGFEFYKLEEAYNPYDATLPHRHNYYEILYFKESGGNHEIDFTSHPVLAHSFHFISPGQVHLLRRARHVTGYVLSFSKDFCYAEAAGIEFVDSFPFFNNPYAVPIVRLEKKENKAVTELIAKIQSEYFSSADDKVNMLASYLTILLVTAKRLYKPQSSSGKPMPSRSEL